jgi:hypothetical protein
VLKASVDQCSKLSNLMYARIKELGTKLDDNHNREQIREALDKISNLNFRTQQARHKSLMERNTGDWFLQSEKLETWLDRSNQTLFCSGILGAGKTMMAASVVNHIEIKLLGPHSSINLAYIFCDYKSEEEQSVDQLWGNLLQQPIQNNQELASSLLALHEAHVEKKSFPSVDEIAGVLLSTIAKHADVYIVVDAIDEYPQKDRKRWRLLKTLRDLHTKTDALHLLVTSRFTPDVVETFKHTPTIGVRADSEDDDTSRVDMRTSRLVSMMIGARKLKKQS